MKPILWIVVILLWFFPVFICALAMWRWRGGWRLAPIIPLMIMLPLLAIDVNSAIHGGNLTGIMTLLAYAISLPVPLVIAVVQSFATRHEQQQSRVSSYIMAALSSVFLFVAVLFLWWLITFLVPDEMNLGQIGVIVYWIVGGLLALVATVHSFRSTIKHLAPDVPPKSGGEATGPNDQSERHAQSAVSQHDEVL
jgi:hypothetical protein